MKFHQAFLVGFCFITTVHADTDNTERYIVAFTADSVENCEMSTLIDLLEETGGEFEVIRTFGNCGLVLKCDKLFAEVLALRADVDYVEKDVINRIK